MELILIGVLLMVLVGAAAWWLRRSRGPVVVGATASDRIDTVIGWPPQPTRIMTTAELLAHATLARAMPGYMVLAQVPLSRFLKVPMRNSYSEWVRRVGQQCADLVVCDMASQVIGVVHVQPAVGESSERALRRHKRMARVLRAAQIPLFTWTEGAFPSADEARRALLPPPLAPATPSGAAAPVAAEAPAPAPRRVGPTPFDDSARDSTQDERIEMAEPPQSTWFDDLDSAPMPLQPPTPPRRP